ncbi:MAG: copper resistance protein CopC [Chloroflexota bacterium]|nr:copper resistance protein CopC [Chloroflexota bacterium]
MSSIIRLKFGLALVLACVAGLAVQSQVVEAHANLVRSEPAGNSTLDVAPERVVIWFTEPMEPDFSEIRVLNSAGVRVDGKDSVVDANDSTIMSVSLSQLPDGTYTVAWRNLSTVDGHSLRGSFVFSVGEPISASAMSPDDAEQPLLQSPEDPFIRWIVLLSALTLTGGLVFELLVSAPVLVAAGTRSPLGRLRPRLRARSQRLMWLALIAFLGASVVQLLVQAATAFGIEPAAAMGAPAIELVQNTDWGRVWMYRAGLGIIVAALFLLPLVVQFLRGHVQARLINIVLLLALLASLGILLTISLTSHAAATLGIARYALLNDVLHLTASAVWVGGLMQLIANTPLFIGGISETARRTALSRIVRRFSAAAALSVIVLGITGVYSAWAQVTEFAALATPYGSALTAKVAIVAALLLVGAVNLIWVVPRLRSNSRAAIWLRRTVIAEIVLATLVLLVVGFLTALEPARQVASRMLASEQQGLDFAGTADGTEILLNIYPASVGQNTFTISLTDRLGEPIDDATDVRLRVSYLDADLGEASVPAENIGGGEYILSDSLISIAGAYQAEILVQRPDAFDARAAFRFELGTAAGNAGGAAAIAPDTARGSLYLAIVLGILGFVFLAAGIPMGGWYNRTGALTMAVGAVAFVMAAWLLISAQAASETYAIVRNPIPPTADSVASGRANYERHCMTCHGEHGLGDGPGGIGLEPPPADLSIHVPLHGDAELFRFVSDGIEGTSMVALSDRLTEDEIWHIINFIRAQADEQNR